MIGTVGRVVSALSPGAAATCCTSGARSMQILRGSASVNPPALETRPVVGSTYFDAGARVPHRTVRELCLRSTRTGKPAVWRANSDGTNQVLIGAIKDGMAGSPRWTPDGQSVVFDVHGRGRVAHVFIVSAEGGAPRRLTTNLE